MGALDGFESTWSKARSTFGQGTPQEGAQFDNSGQLRQMQSTVESAKPGERWTGSGSDAYATVNEKQGRVLGQLAELDQRLRTEVDRSAQVVNAGRQNLDAVRQWVHDAAATVPPGQNRDRMLYPIVSRGAGEIADIVQRSNGDLNAIARRIGGLKGEYLTLAGDLKQGTGEDTEKKTPDDMLPPVEASWAEQDVRQALGGDKAAAARVARVLDSITPGQQLSPAQGSYLSQMQAQQHGMSVGELKTAEQRLGDQKHIVGDSWQLMSNPAVDFPKTELEVGALDDPNVRVQGGVSQLPVSVQEALASPGMNQLAEMNDIANIVKDGNPELQMNTGLDQEMIHKAAVMMDTGEWETFRTGDPVYDPAVSNVLSAVSPDHQVVHDAITGCAEGIDSGKFLDHITHHVWNDDGKAAASLFSWTEGAAHGPEGQIAAETAHAYASFVGKDAPHLLDMAGLGMSAGEANPELIRGISHGLAPYVDNIAGGQNEFSRWFPTPDSASDQGTHKLPIAKGIFSVISTDDLASNHFNQRAYEQIIRDQNSYAAAIANQVPGAVLDDATLQHAQTMQGLVDSGINNAAVANNQDAADAYGRKAMAYQLAVQALTAGASATPSGPVTGPAVEMAGLAMQESILGPRPGTEAPNIGDRTPYNVYSQVLDGLAANQVPIDLDKSYFRPSDPSVEGSPPRIATWEEFSSENRDVTLEQYNQDLQSALGQIVGPENVAIIGIYNAVTEDPSPW